MSSCARHSGEDVSGSIHTPSLPGYSSLRNRRESNEDLRKEKMRNTGCIRCGLDCWGLDSESMQPSTSCSRTRHVYSLLPFLAIHNQCSEVSDKLQRKLGNQNAWRPLQSLSHSVFSHDRMGCRPSVSAVKVVPEENALPHLHSLPTVACSNGCFFRLVFACGSERGCGGTNLTRLQVEKQPKRCLRAVWVTLFFLSLSLLVACVPSLSRAHTSPHSPAPPPPSHVLSRALCLSLLRSL